MTLDKKIEIDEEQVKMEEFENKRYNIVAGAFLLAQLVVCTYGIVYAAADSINNTHGGSFKKFYHAEMNKLNKANWDCFHP